jgi:hypothetical protein
VLAGRNDDRPAALRPGAIVFPLDSRASRRGAAVGAEVTTTATLLPLLPTCPTAVVVVSPHVAMSEMIDEIIHVSYRMLNLDAASDASPTLTVGVACPRPVQPGTAGGMSMYNQHIDALPEAILESVAVARRCGVVTEVGACVLLLQRFAAPTASALVHVLPDPARPVRIDGRWGLIEADPIELSSDTFEVPAEGGSAAEIREQLGSKPTASVTAPGGTRTVSLPASLRHRNSLSRPAVQRLAAMARAAADAVGHPLSLDVAMFDEDPVVLRCRPCVWT